MKYFRDFALLLASGTAVASQSTSEKCIDVCTNEFENINYSAACREARAFATTDDVRVKPTIYQVCRMAWGFGYNDACMATCMGDEVIKESIQLCQEQRREVNREWCVKSYYEAVEYTQTRIALFRPDLSPEAALREEEKVRGFFQFNVETFPFNITNSKDIQAR